MVQLSVAHTLSTNALTKVTASGLQKDRVPGGPHVPHPGKRAAAQLTGLEQEQSSFNV